MEEYKVQLTLNLPPKEQYQKGDMLNVRGQDFNEVHALLTAAYGAEVAADILNEFATERAVATVKSAFPGTEVVTDPAQTQPSPAPAPQPQPQGFGQPPATGQPPAPIPAGAGQLPTCVVCGTTKVHKTGTNARGHYDFWGCPNYQDAAHVQAKAQGIKF